MNIAKTGRSTALKVIDLLELFTFEEPILDAADIAERLQSTRPTTYRYLKTLCDAGFLQRLGNSNFSLGPRIVQMDRQIQLTDPLIAAAKGVMADALRIADWQAILLCSLAGTKVLCIHHEVKGSEVRLARGRGMPFPLFKGPASLIILAHLPAGQVRKLLLSEPNESGIPKDSEWLDGLRKQLRQFKRQGYARSASVVQSGMVGIAAPLFHGNGKVIGSLAGVVREEVLTRQPEAELASVITSCAATVNQKLAAQFSSAG